MNVRDFFEDLAKRGAWGSLYDGKQSALNYNFLTRRIAVTRLLEGDGTFERILDVGCGTGDYAQVAAAHESSFHGMDFSPEMVNQARQRVGKHGQHAILLASGEHIPYQDNTFDLVLAIGYIEYLRDPTITLEEIGRVLKPGGILVIQSHQRGILGTLSQGVGGPLRFVYRRLFRKGARRLQPGSEVVVVRYSQRRLDRVLAGFGFAQIDYAFNNYFAFPSRFRSTFPRLSIGLSETITRSNPKSWGILAVNYIGKYTIEKSSPEHKL